MRPEFHGSREVDGVGKISTIRRLFQGPTRSRKGRGYTYPGDMAYCAANRISIQVHRYDLEHDGNVLAQQVPVIAVWVPRRLSLDWLIQDQPN